MFIETQPQYAGRPGGTPRVSKGGSLYAEFINATPPPGLLLFSIFSIQIGSALAVHLFASFGALGTTAFRLMFAAGLLLVWCRPSWNAQLKANALLLVAYGLAIVAMNTCFYLALERIPLGVAVAIEFTGPLGLAAIMSRRLLDFLWIALAAFGIFLLSPFAGSEYDFLGIMFAAIAGVGWAMFVVLSGKIGRIFPGNLGLAIGMSIAAIFIFPLALEQVSVVIHDPLLILSLVAVAILSTTIPLSLEFEALKRISAKTYGILISLEPAVAALVGMLLLDELLQLRGLVAVTCVTIAALGVAYFDKSSS